MHTLPAHTLLAPASPQAPTGAGIRWMLFLHGIFGSGVNWRSFARRLQAAQGAAPRLDLGAVLVDLRMHGDSQTLPPPHSLRSCAQDLLALEAALPGPVRAVLGHSFGGKVALAYLQARHDQGLPPLDEAWIIDSTPSARPDHRGSESTVAVLGLLRELVQDERGEREGGAFPTREAFVLALTRRGIARDLAQWLAMNLRPQPGGALHLRLDLDAMEALLADYFRVDLWEALGRGADQVHLVAGGRSAVLSEDDRRRAQGLGPNVHLHVLPRAGHFVHVDDPEGLLALMTGGTDSL